MAPSTSSRDPHPPSTWILWGAPLGALLVEYLAVSLCFDVEPLAERAGWLGLLGRVGAVGPAVLAVATATLLLGGRELGDELREALVAGTTSVQVRRGRLGWLLALHGIAFGALVTLTHLLVKLEAPAPPRLLLLAWAGSCICVVLTAAQAMVPLATLLPLLRRRARTLVVGAGVGMGAWAAGVWAERLWAPLTDATFVFAGGLLRLLGAEVTADLATGTLGVDGFEVVISSACSGYQGMGLLLVLMAAYLWIFRRELRFPAVFLVVPLAVTLVWLANGVRIAALMALGAWGSAEVALGGFHSKAGWVLFCAIVLGAVALTRRSPLFHRRAREERAAAAPTWNPTASYLLPLLALVAARMLTNLFSAGFDALYPVGAAAAAVALWLYRDGRPRLAPFAWSWSAVALGVLTFALWVTLVPVPDPSAVVAFENGLGALSPSARTLWIASRVLGSVVVVPVVEELAFRGYLLRRLVSPDFTRVPFGRFAWSSFLASSLAFGLLHQSWLAGCLAGMLFALAQYRRGRLGDAVLAHAVANLLIACSVLGWEHWWLWL